MAQRLVCDLSQCCLELAIGEAVCWNCVALVLRSVSGVFSSAQPSRIGCVSWTPPGALSWELDGQRGLTAPRLPLLTPGRPGALGRVYSWLMRLLAVLHISTCNLALLSKCVCL